MRILTSSKRLIAFAAVLAGVALATPNQARADLELSWSASNAIIGSSANDTTALFNATSGGFSTNGSANGTGTGFFGPGVAGLDLSSFSATSSGPGTLILYLTETNQTSPVGLGIISTEVTVNSVSGAVLLTLQAFGNDNNLAYGNATGQAGTTPLVSGLTNVATPAVGPSVVGTASFNAISPYSLTEILTINFVSAGTVSISSDSKALFSAPEPGTIAMALTALPLLGLGVARRRRTVA